MAQQSLNPSPAPVIGDDDTQLLAGEDPNTVHAADAAHWMKIYQELTAFQQVQLTRDQTDGIRLSREAHLAAVRFDPIATAATLARYRRRLDFWYDRRWRLQGLEIDPTTFIATHRGRDVRLTRREYELLSLLLAHAGETFSAPVLARRAWSGALLSTAQVRIYIVRLRLRLLDPGVPSRIIPAPPRAHTLACEQSARPDARPLPPP